MKRLVEKVVEKNPFAGVRKVVVLVLLITFVLASAQCDKILPCNKSFDTILLTLKYPDEQPVQLDSSKILWISKNRFLEQQRKLPENDFSERGWYVIVDDRMKEELRNKREIMRFTGYLDGKIVHQQDVQVGANRCHVEYLGKEPLIQIVRLD